jgi:hypothetical protein
MRKNQRICDKGLFSRFCPIYGLQSTDRIILGGKSSVKAGFSLINMVCSAPGA